ncbi:MAG: hypothetical protein OXG09_00025 [Chloroflexi bacterium]|nr:hypothetical protein [Chloroflexota bacterium]MCY3958699.1 hypothetical protein [Chloroflexota bacterium]
MLFTCLPPAGPCEWRELAPFVVAYNEQHGTSYFRSQCLDVEIRDRPAPEVLLEAQGEPSIVIERKSIVWPPGKHLANHRNEHNLSEYLSEALRSHGDDFSDSLYQLSVQEVSLHGKRDRDVAAIARTIASDIASHADEARSFGGIGRSSPIPWNFRAVHESERDETTPTRGIGVIVCGSIDYHDPAAFRRKRESANDGFREEFGRQASAAAEKFSDYSDCLRSLLVQFFGDPEFGPTDEEIKKIVVSSQRPKDIDQVWVADEKWVSADDYEIEWVHLT